MSFSETRPVCQGDFGWALCTTSALLVASACECLQVDLTAVFSVPKGLRAGAREFRRRFSMGLLTAWHRKVE